MAGQYQAVSDELADATKAHTLQLNTLKAERSALQQQLSAASKQQAAAASASSGSADAKRLSEKECSEKLSAVQHALDEKVSEFNDLQAQFDLLQGTMANKPQDVQRVCVLCCAVLCCAALRAVLLRAVL